MASPLVSVIIATYNRSNVLRYAIQSVLWQTFQDFEILVIGDACTDHSAEVVASFADPRIRWHNLSQNSGSQSTPNNTGLDMARGPFVAYLGHDDLWYPTHLELLLRRIRETGADIAYTLCELIGVPGSGVKSISGLTASGQYERGLIVPPSSVMHKREMIRDTGPWKDFRMITLPPDVEILVRAYDCGKQFAAVRELTVVKPTASDRRNVYIQKPDHEQAEYARRIESEPDFLYRELLDLVVVHALGKAILIYKSEVPTTLTPGWLVDQWRKARGLDPLVTTQRPVAGLVWSFLNRLPAGIKGRLRRIAKTLVFALKE
jgi:glycosyltransferase involved in cell wall biosynthesis